MRRLARLMACSLALGSLALATSTGALAGTSTSAGDQQYVDPLTTKTSTTAPAPAPAPTTTGSSTISQSPPSSISGTASSSTGTSTTGSTTSNSPAASAAAPALPYTGLNVGACLALGAGLLGTGLWLRRFSPGT